VFSSRFLLSGMANFGKFEMAWCGCGTCDQESKGAVSTAGSEPSSKLGEVSGHLDCFELLFHDV